MDESNVVILVVGNDANDKTDVVDQLAQGDAWETQTTPAGARVLSRQSPARVIIDTTVLRSVSGRSPVATARRWISQNSLRRMLFGKLVFVVCVVKCSITKERCNWDIFYYSNCWLDIFGLIFDGHKGSIMILVNTQGNYVDDVTKLQVKQFVKEHKFLTKNIIYSSFRKEDDSIRRAVDESVSLGEIVVKKASLCSLSSLKKLVLPKRSHCGGGSCSSCFNIRRTQPVTEVCDEGGQYVSLPPTSFGPFRMEAVSAEECRFGPWGPERVILFGRTGSGKSTLAQMLTSGKLNSGNGVFTTTSSVRGGTRTVEHGEGRGWYVVDTPGFGEPKGQDSTISTREAEKKIKQYVKNVEGTFSHYLFVVKKDRMDVLEDRLWKFFVQLFGDDISHQFSVVLSGADSDWLQENRRHLENCFKGCSSFLPAEFPAPESGDEEHESELEEIRMDALKELEDALSCLGRTDLHCKYGEHSQMHIINERDRTNLDMRIEKDIRIKILAGGANVVCAVGNLLSNITSPISHLTSLLTVDDHVTLLPL